MCGTSTDVKDVRALDPAYRPTQAHLSCPRATCRRKKWHRAAAFKQTSSTGLVYHRELRLLITTNVEPINRIFSS